MFSLIVIVNVILQQQLCLIMIAAFMFRGAFIGIRRLTLNPFNPEFTIVIFIHYKPRIAAAILDL